MFIKIYNLKNFYKKFIIFKIFPKNFFFFYYNLFIQKFKLPQIFDFNFFIS